MKLHGSLNIRENDLYIGDIKISDISHEFKTPCYIMDENLIRDNIKRFKSSVGEDNVVVYAGKTFLNTHMVEILKDEDIYLDVVSHGELYIAHRAGFDMKKIVFHGNNKSYEEVKFGIEMCIGRFVCDSIYELNMIYELSKELNKRVDVFLRINPGIDAHTHEYIKTACIDSKFGIYKDKDIILDILNKYKNDENVNIVGFHCHIGSQIFSKDAYIDEVDEVFSLVNEATLRGFDIKEVNLGGGFGIYYTEGDTPMEIEDQIRVILDRVYYSCEKFDLSIPKIYIEPGRSIVGNAGTTIYKIGCIKEIQHIRNYVSVDGGMSDNIRTALYDADYECLIVNKASMDRNYRATISGKCCESGDVLIKDTYIASPHIGDILAVFSTGAYCHSMSSNYNKLMKPPIVFFYNNSIMLTTRRERLEDLVRLDVPNE